MRPAAILPVALAALLTTVSFDGLQGAVRPMSPAQRSYTEGCGGCHGLTGISATAVIPSLRGGAAQLFCAREGRDYMVRLPNVAFANMTDERLAEVMNFVVFGLGGVSPGPHAAPYTSAEVHELRGKPLKAADLVAVRAAVLKNGVSCAGDVARAAAFTDE